MKTRDYTFRTRDISLFPIIGEGGGGLDVQMDPHVCTGKSKASQNYFRLLMTPIGSFPSDPDAGSEFFKATEGRNLSEPELLNLFASENLRVIEYLTTIQQGKDIPDDERIVEGRLSSVAVSRTGFSIVVELSFADGDPPLPFVLPIKNSAIEQ